MRPIVFIIQTYVFFMQHHVLCGNIVFAGCNTMFRETVDGQKIAPLHGWFRFAMQNISCPCLTIPRCLSPPSSPPCSMLLCLLHWRVFVSGLCSSLLVASWIRSPILNPEGCGEIRVSLLVVVSMPLVCFSGAIFCPSTVKTMCFFVYAHAFQNKYATLR